MNELQHHGILGQKWGVRRYQPYPKGHIGGREVGEAARKAKSELRLKNKEKKRQMRNDVKNRHLLSDADLKKKIERIKMEKQLKDITTGEISKGKKTASDVLQSSGKKIATVAITGAGLYAIKAAANKNFDIKELAAFMTPKPKFK